MAAPKGTIVPQGDHGVAARVTRHRFRAIVDEVLAGLLGPGAKRDAGGRDLVERLQAECLSDTRPSSAALGDLLKLVPVDTVAPGSTAGGMVANIGALYLQALQAPVQVAAPLIVGELPVIDVTPEPEPAGYIEGTAVDKPLITLNEW